MLPDGKPVRTRIVTAGEGASTLATGELPASVILEENGPVYARVRSSVTFPDAAGQPALTIICRIEAWRGAKVAKLSHSFLVQGKPLYSTFESIDLEVPVAASSWASRPMVNPDLLQNDRAFQRREHELLVNQRNPSMPWVTSSLATASTSAALLGAIPQRRQRCRRLLRLTLPGL